MSSAVEQLDEILSRPPEGVIVPPKELRTIIEKTAGYVARNGPSFAERIRAKEGNNAKFSFLVDEDAYNAFYNWRIQEIKEGRGSAVAAGRENEVAKVAAKPKGPDPPPDFHFSARLPNISAVDLEVMKLTALFQAKNGPSFRTSLGQRESSNAQFDFLRPTHSFNQYYTRLVDQYTDLLAGNTAEGAKKERARIAELEANVRDRFRIMERAKQRADWTKLQETQKVRKEEQEQKEQQEYAQIDWQDWALAETVVFTDKDDEMDLPPPTSLNELQSMSLEQKAVTSHNLRIEEAMPGEDLSQYMSAPQPPLPPAQMPMPMPPMPMGLPHMPVQQPMYAPQPVQYPYPQQPQYPQYAPQPPQFQPQLPPQYDVPSKRPAPEDDEDAARIEERRLEQERAQQARAAAGAGPGNVRIQAQAGPRAKPKGRVQMAQCPQCKEMYPVDELSEHIRSELQRSFHHLNFVRMINC